MMSKRYGALACSGRSRALRVQHQSTSAANRGAVFLLSRLGFTAFLVNR